MAFEGALADKTTSETLYVGGDHAIDVVVYADKDKTTVLDTSAWTTLTLDIRKYETSTTALLTKNGVRSGTFNATPGSNTQKWTFTLTDDDLAASAFTGNEFEGYYSIWRKDANSQQPIRYGTAVIVRTTQT